LGLKSAEVCRRLTVTSGSFDHCFDSWRHYKRELVEHWRTEATFRCLEADAERQLHRPLLIDRAGGLVGIRHATEVADRVEVGVVENVEHLSLTFDHDSLRDLDLLDQVHVEADHLRSGDDEAADAAVAEAVDGFDAVRRVGGGEVAAGGRAGGVAGGIHAERFDGVVDNVLRKHVEQRAVLVLRIGHHAELVCVANIARSHAEEPQNGVPARTIAGPGNEKPGQQTAVFHRWSEQEGQRRHTRAIEITDEAIRKFRPNTMDPERFLSAAVMWYNRIMLVAPDTQERQKSAEARKEFEKVGPPALSKMAYYLDAASACQRDLEQKGLWQALPERRGEFTRLMQLLRKCAFTLSVALQNNRAKMTQDLRTWNIWGPLGKN